MIVIYGWRTMGKVDEVENQYALTKFFHLFWLPIVPYGSVWVLDHASGSGHAIKMHGKSILAAYVRWWGSIIGGLCVLGAIQTASIALGVVAATLLALVVASWRWSRLHSRTVSDANLAAFGTRCEPKLMLGGLATELHGATARMWAEVADGKTPSDIARFGARDKRQATLAYAQLRLAALNLHGTAAREAEQEALRILENVRELPAAEPYRSAPAVTAALAQQVAAPVDRAPVPSSATDELAGRIATRITAELAGDKFTPRPAPELGLTIDLVLRRDGLRKNFLVIVLRAPDSYGGLGMGTPPLARAITDHVGGGTVAVVYVGADLGTRVERLEAGLFKEEIAVRGIFAVDAASGSVTIAAPSTTESAHLILEKIGRAIAQAVAPVSSAS